MSLFPLPRCCIFTWMSLPFWLLLYKNFISRPCWLSIESPTRFIATNFVEFPEIPGTNINHFCNGNWGATNFEIVLGLSNSRIVRFFLEEWNQENLRYFDGSLVLSIYCNSNPNLFFDNIPSCTMKQLSHFVSRTISKSHQCVITYVMKCRRDIFCPNGPLPANGTLPTSWPQFFVVQTKQAHSVLEIGAASRSFDLATFFVSHFACNCIGWSGSPHHTWQQCNLLC